MSGTAFRFEKISVVDVLGTDAEKIVHNLTTNEIKSLVEGGPCRETFVTNVKGKTVGHVLAARIENGFRLVGAAGQSEAVAAHLDRYTIVEDSEPHIRDDEFAAVLVVADTVPPTPTGSWACQTPWLGQASQLMLVPVADADKAIGQLGSEEVLGEVDFHLERIRAGFPWFGIDFSDANLPQEVDRDQQGISFTKGCYLGQETVARLDAMGQVQKKLVRWRINGTLPEPGTTVVADGKKVGKLTSIGGVGDLKGIAIGMARRSHFEPGAVANAEVQEGQPSFTAEVAAL